MATESDVALTQRLLRVRAQLECSWALAVCAQTQRQVRAARTTRMRVREQVTRSIDRWLTARGLVRDPGGPAHEDVLGLVLEAARALFARCDSTSLTVVEQLSGNQPPYSTAAATGIAEALDATQYRLCEGPSVEAVELDMVAVVQADDLATAHDRQTWPRFSQAAQELGVRSALSVAVPWTPLHVGLHPQRQALAAINFYAREPHAFDQAERHGTVLSSWVAAVVTGRDAAEVLYENV